MTRPYQIPTKALRAKQVTAAIPDVALVSWRALAAGLDEGTVTPCQSAPDAWTAAEQETRARAALACAGCPLLEQCGDYAAAAGERWGVWAGHDRTTRPQARR